MKYEHYDLLMKMVDDGYVNVQKHPTFDYYIYNYSQTTQFEKKWNDATLQARGLILNGSGEIIARPFKKFFNFQEYQYNQIPWKEEFCVTEKVDGSLGITYIGEDGQLYMATRGSFTSEQAIRGTEFLRNNQACSSIVIALDNIYTCLFEIVYKENRIVVDYGDFEGLIFLASVDKELGDVCTPRYSAIRMSNAVRIVEEFVVADIPELLQHKKDNFEGYVITFENGFQMKVKLDEYVRLHRLMTNVSNVSVWESLKNGDNIESLLNDVPDEFYDWIKTIIVSLETSFNDIERKAREYADKYRGYERAYIAKKILHEAPKDVKNISGIIFGMLDGKEYKQHIWKMIRPEYQRPFYQSKESI